LRPRRADALRPSADPITKEKTMQLATKLVSTRKGTLLVALLIAMLAGASILLYLNSYRDSLKSQGALVTVLVAKQTIPKGTSGGIVAAKDFYTVTTIRESQLLEGAISDPATLRNKVASREIFEGAQLTAVDFASAGDSLVADLTDRQRIVSVPLDTAHGLIDAIEPGNRVDVYAGMNVIWTGPDGKPNNGGQTKAVVRLIIQNVPVLAIGEKKRSGSGTTNVSLRLDDRTAAKIAFASDNGKVWLALRPSAGAKASRPDIVTAETLLLGIPPVVAYKALGGRS
jgi:pilus assembly protein CpaB